MGLFRSSKHPQKDGKPPAPPSSNECAPALTRSLSSHHSISAKSSSAPHTRFQVFPDGTHAHYIKCPSSNRASLSLHNLAGIFHRDTGKPFKLSLFGDKKAAAAAAAGALQKERNAVDAELRRTPSSACLTEKWGTVNEVIGRGAFGVVRIAHKPNENGERLYAVKEVRKKSSESTKHYVKRLTAEFCISSSLHQRNVIRTLDLLPLNETSSVYCQVMEYCDGGDLFNVICEFASNGLQVPETNCFFKQLMLGVQYLHSMGVAHRDLKPENLLLTHDGCLKISDFGGADCFQASESDEVLYSRGVCGSEPYIAPEEFSQPEYDPRQVDVWSCGVIYMAMHTGNHMWQVAKKGEDENYDRYLKFRRLVEEERENAVRERMQKQAGVVAGSDDREAKLQRARESIRKRAKESGLDILEGLEFETKKLIYRMLNPDPKKRATVPQIMENQWFKSVYCCQQQHQEQQQQHSSAARKEA